MGFKQTKLGVDMFMSFKKQEQHNSTLHETELAVVKALIANL